MSLARHPFPAKQPGALRISLGWTSYLDQYDAWLNEQNATPLKLRILKTVIQYAREMSVKTGSESREVCLSILAKGQNSDDKLLSTLESECDMMSGELSSQPRIPNSRLYTMLSSIRSDVEQHPMDPYAEYGEAKNAEPLFKHSTQAAALAAYQQRKETLRHVHTTRFVILSVFFLMVMLMLSRGHVFGSLIFAVPAICNALFLASHPTTHRRLFNDTNLRETQEFAGLRDRYQFLVRHKAQYAHQRFSSTSLMLANFKVHPDAVTVLNAIGDQLYLNEMLPWVKQDKADIALQLDVQPNEVKEQVMKRYPGLLYELRDEKLSPTPVDEGLGIADYLWAKTGP